MLKICTTSNQHDCFFIVNLLGRFLLRYTMAEIDNFCENNWQEFFEVLFGSELQMFCGLCMILANTGQDAGFWPVRYQNLWGERQREHGFSKIGLY